VPHDQQVIRIATRNSPLALWQAEHVAGLMRAAHPEIETRLIRMTTRGDKILDAPLAKVGGKGLFVKELEQGMLEGHADIAVHSMKDVPVDLPEGLHIAVILRRECPRDAFVSNRFPSLDDLPDGARIGTSSLRRQCQISAKHPNSTIVTLRGNVNTRLSKLDKGEYDAIVLAVAGLRRLGFGHRITQEMNEDVSLPAIGQGAIGVECRRDDHRTNEWLVALHDEGTSLCITAERAMNERLQGGCQVPIAGFAEFGNGQIRLRGLVGQPDGSEIIRGEIVGAADSAQRLGRALADDLLGRGAGRILRALYSTG
jgi:hydroxymethylbilane synthase